MCAGSAPSPGCAAEVISHSTERGARSRSSKQALESKELPGTPPAPQLPFQARKFASKASRALYLEFKINSEQIHAASLCL